MTVNRKKVVWFAHLVLVFLLYSYSTVYTMAPVFSLVLDEDVSPDVALTYPELYKDLMKVKLIDGGITLAVRVFTNGLF